MLWTALMPWAALCLAGFAGGDDDFDYIFWYPGRRKLESIDEDEYGSYEPRSAFMDMINNDYSPISEKNMNSRPFQDMYFMDNANPFLGNYLAYTKLCLYSRNKQIEVIKGSEWFENFDRDKDLVIMVHGVSKDQNYVENFFNTIAFALLQNGDYNIIGIDWRYFVSRERDVFDIERNAQEASKISYVLNAVIGRAMNPRHPMQVPKTTYIGHDMGSIPVVVHSTTYGVTFDSVYGLNQRSNIPNHEYLTLTQMHGHLVHTLSTINTANTLSHKEFRPVYNNDFYYAGNYGNLAYQILANAIMYGNMTARFCSSEQDYIQGYCSRLSEVPLWSRQMSLSCGEPVGKYYFELPKPMSRPYCDGQTFIHGGSN